MRRRQKTEREDWAWLRSVPLYDDQLLLRDMKRAVFWYTTRVDGMAGVPWEIDLFAHLRISPEVENRTGHGWEGVPGSVLSFQQVVSWYTTRVGGMAGMPWETYLFSHSRISLELVERTGLG
jgi:hypothetical protein